MAINNSQFALPAPQLSAAMTGANVLIGTLSQSPVIIILDNQSTTAVDLSINDVLWKTFSAGQNLVLDMRGNHGVAPNFTFSVGDSFYGNGLANGSFCISYLYAKNT